MPDRTTPPAIRQIEHFYIQQPELYPMSNGIPLHIIRAGSENVVRFDLLIKAGQLNQTQCLQATFTNRMLREGTRSMRSVEIAGKLDYYGAWLDLSSSVNCSFITLYSLEKYFPQTMEVLASMVKEPSFPASELAVVTDVNRQQFLVNSQRVETLARKQLNRSLFGTLHPLGRYAELEDYNRLSPEKLKAFYDTYYHSDNCSAYISGHVTQNVLRCIEQHFGNARWGDTQAPSVSHTFTPTPDNRKRVFIAKEDALQSSLKMGCFAPDRKHPDYLKLRILTTLLGGYFGSRLMSNIREEKGYTYGIGAGVVSYPGTSVLMIGTEAANEYIEPIITEVYREMDKLCQERVPEKELEMVRNYMLGDMCRSYESAFSLSDAWIFVETADLDDTFFERSLSSIRDVNAEDIRTLAQRYFRKEGLIEVIAGKKV